MRKGDFVEASDREFASQLGRFAINVVVLAPIFDISEEDVAGIQADAAAMRFAQITQGSIVSLQKAWTSYKDTLRNGEQGKGNTIPRFREDPDMPAQVPDGIEGRFRGWVRRIKAHKNYTAAHGQQLSMVASPVGTLQTETARPKIFQLGISGGKVFLKWRKGRFDGINVYRKIGDGPLVLVGTDLKPNWVDPTPLPDQAEVWTYRIMYIKDDVEVGSMSVESQILVMKIV